MTSIFLINKREKKNFISLKVFGSASSSFPWHFPSSDAVESPLLFHPFKSHHYPSHGTWLMAFCLGTSITIQSASSITASPPNHLSILRGTLTCSWRTWMPQGSNEIQQSWTDHHCHKNRNGSEMRAPLTQKACKSRPRQHLCPHCQVTYTASHQSFTLVEHSGLGLKTAYAVRSQLWYVFPFGLDLVLVSTWPVLALVSFWRSWWFLCLSIKWSWQHHDHLKELKKKKASETYWSI